MRVIILSNMLGYNPFNLCVLGANKTSDEDVKDAIKYFLMKDYKNQEGSYYVYIEPSKYGDFAVVVTTDQYIEPVAVYMAKVQTVLVYGT